MVVELPREVSTSDQALEMLEQLGRFEAVQKDSLPEFMHFLSKYEEHIRKRQKQNGRQRKITDFFSNTGP